MEHKLDILATRQAIMEVIDTFFDWCIPRDDTDCSNCPHRKTCDGLHDIRDELLSME